MSTVWKIGSSTTAYEDASTFAALGLSNLRRELRSASMDTVTFTHTSLSALTADSPFTYKATYIVWRKDGAAAAVRWFQGLCLTIPRQGNGRTESQQITLGGPWWYFQEVPYQQPWKVWSLTAEELQDVYKPRVVLGQNAAGARLDSGGQVADVVDWLILRGVPILKGTIDTGTQFPYDEQINLKCSQVVDTMLRYLPDWVAWFDYSTVTPTFHFRKRSNLTPVSISVNGPPLSDLNISPRYDLQKPGVKILYEKVNSVDQLVYNTVEEDTAGDTGAYDCVHACFDLQGSTITYLKQKIETAAFPETSDASATKKAWLKAHVPWANQILDADLTVGDITHTPAVHLPNILTKGQVQDWMEKDGTPLTSSTVKISLAVGFIFKNVGAVAVLEFRLINVNVTVKATDAESKTYKELASFDSGEPTPTGVAAALYASWAILHYDGSFTLTEDECLGACTLGSTLNLTDGVTGWATMAALIQSISEDVDTGTTSVTFGPPPALEADSLVGLFRQLRGRRFSAHRLEKTSGESEGTASVELSGVGPNDVPDCLPGEKIMEVWKAEVEE